MNYDSVWQIVRYGLIMVATFWVGYEFANSKQFSSLLMQMDAVIPALITVITTAWGMYVKWNTTPVPDTVIEKRSLPVVSGLTGTVGKEKAK